MTRRAVQNVQENFADTVTRVADTGERIVLQSQGKDVAVLVPLEDLALLEEIEDRLDLEDFRAAKEEWEQDGKKTIPWEKIKTDLGL